MSFFDQTISLNDGTKMPLLGLGTWQLPDGDIAYNSVATALKLGYRMIDTACGYGNEESVGRAIRDSGIPRDEIYVVTKLPAEIKEYNAVLESFRGSKERLDIGPINLYLIHAPWPWEEVGKHCDDENVETFSAFEELIQKGEIISGGISNFAARDIRPLLTRCKIKPAVNQLCHYAGYWEQDAVELCEKENIQVMAYSPLGSGHVFKNEALLSLAKKYNVSVAQLCVRYLFQQGIPCIPRSQDSQRIKDNVNIDFTISEEDIQFINSLR